MKKVLLVTLSLALIIAMMTGCGNQKLSDKFDEDTVKKAAEDAIKMINDGNYKDFSETLPREDIKDALNEEVIKNAIEQVMPNAGAFVEFSSETVVGNKDKDGNDNAMIVIVAKYENQKVTYTIGYDENMKLIAFYLK